MIDPAGNEMLLLTRLKAGSEEAFSEIYRLYWEKLFFIAHKRLHSAEDAKEVIQEVFLTIWQKRAQLNIQSLPFYLGAMTRYAVYRHLTKAKRRLQYIETAAPGDTFIEAFDVDNKQLLDILLRLSNELPVNQRLVFIHHKLLDRPLQEVADQLGVSLRTAEGYSARVLEFMRRHRRQLLLSPLMWLL